MVALHPLLLSGGTAPSSAPPVLLLWAPWSPLPLPPLAVAPRCGLWNVAAATQKWIGRVLVINQLTVAPQASHTALVGERTLKRRFGEKGE